MPIGDELQALMDRYVAAYRAADAAACAACFTDDAELRSPFGPPAIGRAEIEKVHAEWTAEGSAAKTVEVASAGMSGDLAWCLADFAEGGETGEGSTLAVLERQGDGGWLIRICALTP